MSAEGLVNGITSLGAASSNTNRDKLIEDADFFLAKYTDTKGVGDMDMSVLFDEITDLASKHYITLPGQFTMLGRSLLAIEGVIEQLCSELDLFKILSDKMIERTKKNFDLKQSVLDIGKDLLNTGKKTAKIPGLLSDALYGLAKGKMKLNMELSGIDEPLEKIGVYVKYVVLSLIAVVGIVFAIALAIYSVGKLTKK